MKVFIVIDLESSPGDCVYSVHATMEDAKKSEKELNDMSVGGRVTLVTCEEINGAKRTISTAHQSVLDALDNRDMTGEIQEAFEAYVAARDAQEAVYKTHVAPIPAPPKP